MTPTWAPAPGYKQLSPNSLSQTRWEPWNPTALLFFPASLDAPVPDESSSAPSPPRLGARRSCPT